MFSRLIAGLIWAYMAVSSVFFFGIALVIFVMTRPFDRNGKALHFFTSFWGYHYLWIVPAWHVRISGREKLLTGPKLMVSNHLSLLDILVAFGLFHPFKWVSKAEVFKVPLIGWNMHLNRYIPIHRGSKDSGRQMLAAAEKALRAGTSVYLFPEGTRSRNDEMRPFKPGAFVLAHQLQLPIQPIVIQGTQNALPKNSTNFHGTHKISLQVLEPLPYASFAKESVEETAQRVRDLIQTHLQSATSIQSHD